MRMERCVPLTLIAGISLALGACGGSGSGSTTPPPEPPVNVAPPLPTIAMSGKVTDMPIANATVIVTVNGQSFEAPLPTAADGSYSVDIQSADPDALVFCEAIDPNGAVHFSAIVDSYAAVEQAAGAGAQVTDVNITNVTTAQHVLAKRLTDDGSIDSAEELADTVSRVDTEDLLELSAAIKLVVENIDGVVLPSELDDTLALAEAIVAGESTFLEDVAASAPGALETAVDLVLTDGNATMPFAASTVPGVYVSQDNLSLFAMLPAGYGFAVSYERDMVTMFDWEVNQDGVLNLWFGGEQPYVEEVTLLDRTSDVVNVVVRASDDSSSGQPTTASYAAFDTGFTAAGMPGSYSTIGERGNLTVFAADGSGYNLNLATGAQDDAFAWSVDEDGGLMLTHELDGSISYARRLAGSTDTNLRVLIWEMRADGTLADVSVIDALRSADDVSGGVTGEASALLLAGTTYAVTESDEIGLFSFNADGRFSEIYQRYDSQGGLAGEEEGTWNIDATGTVNTQLPSDSAPQSATIMQGLGEDFMVVQTNSDQNSVMQVTRIVPIVDRALVVGSFTIVDEATGVATATVRLLENFTGVYIGEDGVGEDFEWGLNSDGRLVVETLGGDDFDSETITFYMLAGSGGDVLRFILVHRVNGELRTGDPSTGEAPEALELLTLQRTS